jgi:hypothetical protein
MQLGCTLGRLRFRSTACNSEVNIRLGIPPSILSVEWVELPASQICSVNDRGNLQLIERP